jgi:hypothetical protein
MTIIYFARLRLAQGRSLWESFGQRIPIIHPRNQKKGFKQNGAEFS